MEKKIALALLFLLLIIIGLKLNSELQKGPGELKFTSYMDRYVNLYLRGINCSPKGAEIENQRICYLCNGEGIKVCFGYVFAGRNKEEANPYGKPSIEGAQNLTYLLKFYSLGISSLLNCRCGTESFCQCKDNIKAEFDQARKTVYFTFNTSDRDEIFEFWNSTLGNCTLLFVKEPLFSFRCKDFLGYGIKNKIWFEVG